MGGIFAVLALSGCMMKPRMERSELVALIIRACLETSDRLGQFTKSDAFALLANSGDLRTQRGYRIFKEMILTGDVIPLGNRTYRLKEGIARAIELAQVAHVERKVVEKEKLVLMPGLAEAVLEHLNKLTGRKFRVTDKVRTLVNSRVKEGAKPDDFILVLDKKFDEWKGTKLVTFLRPETLLGNKFNSYLNQLEKESKISKMESMDFDRFFGGTNEKS